jgi:glycosyltransferase involved in cell wall biosynthesis
MNPKLNTPLVSVVTPVYNGEAHLRQCIESVLAQTYTHWNYSIVDNCSTDRTYEIASEYAARDARIRVHRLEKFVRVVANYNNALRQVSADSTYCKVVAADDWLFPECLERMVALAEAHPTVAIVGAFQLAGNGIATEGLPRPVTRGVDVCRMQLLGGPYVFGTPTTVMFRSDIVRSRHAFYNESNLHADDEACVEALEHNDFGFVQQILTFRRVHEDSLSSISIRLNTYTPGLLHLLVRHGAKYLTPEELKARIDEILAEYYHALGADLLKGRDQEFWRFHRRKLEELGYPFSKLRLAAAAVSVAADLLLNPKASLERAIVAFRKRTQSKPRLQPTPARRLRPLRYLANTEMPKRGTLL